jgi:hypothetical protein
MTESMLIALVEESMLIALVEESMLIALVEESTIPLFHYSNAHHHSSSTRKDVRSKPKHRTLTWCRSSLNGSDASRSADGLLVYMCSPLVQPLVGNRSTLITNAVPASTIHCCTFSVQ